MPQRPNAPKLTVRVYAATHNYGELAELFLERRTATLLDVAVAVRSELSRCGDGDEWQGVDIRLFTYVGHVRGRELGPLGDPLVATTPLLYAAAAELELEGGRGIGSELLLLADWCATEAEAAAYARAEVPRLTAAAERLQQYVDEAEAELSSVADRFVIFPGEAWESYYWDINMCSGKEVGTFDVRKREVAEGDACAADVIAPTTHHNFGDSVERFLQRTREAASSQSAPSFEQVVMRASVRVSEALLNPMSEHTPSTCIPDAAAVVGALPQWEELWRLEALVASLAVRFVEAEGALAAAAQVVYLCLGYFEEAAEMLRDILCSDEINPGKRIIAPMDLCKHNMRRIAAADDGSNATALAAQSALRFIGDTEYSLQLALLSAAGHGSLRTVRFLVEVMRVRADGGSSHPSSGIMTEHDEERRERWLKKQLSECVRIPGAESAIISAFSKCSWWGNFDLISALHFAAFGGHNSVVMALVEEFGYFVDVAYGHVTPLHCAAMMGHTATLTLLTTLGARVGQRGEDGKTALHYAASTGQCALIRILCEDLSANILEEDYDGWGAIHFAADGGFSSTVRTIVSIACPRFFLHGGGKGEILSSFPEVSVIVGKAITNVQHQSDIDEHDLGHEGMTPILLAAQKGHEETVRALVQEFGADVNGEACRDMNALMHALAGCHVALAKLLVFELGADPNSCDYTPLHFAAACGDLFSVRALVEDLGADPWQLNGAQESPLELAVCEDESVPIMRIISRTINTSHERYVWKALHKAARNGNVDAMRFIAEELKVSVNAAIIDGMSALHVAVQSGKEEAVQTLVKDLGADVNIAVQNTSDFFVGARPLHLAAADSSGLRMLWLLRELGADPNAVDAFGLAPLHYACSAHFCELWGACSARFWELWGSPAAEILKLLAGTCSEGQGSVDGGQFSASVSAHQSHLTHHPTLLHLAAHNGRRDFVSLLVSNGAYVNASVRLITFDHSGGVTTKLPLIPQMTALECAAAKGHLSIVRQLLSSGASSDPVACLGPTRAFGNDPHCGAYLCHPPLASAGALHCAVQGGHVDIVRDLVVEWGADVNAVDGCGRSALQSAMTRRPSEVYAFAAEQNFEDKIIIPPRTDEIEKKRTEAMRILIEELGANTAVGTTAAEMQLALDMWVGFERKGANEGEVRAVGPTEEVCHRELLLCALRHRHVATARLLLGVKGKMPESFSEMSLGAEARLAATAFIHAAGRGDVRAMRGAHEHMKLFGNDTSDTACQENGRPTADARRSRRLFPAIAQVCVSSENPYAYPYVLDSALCCAEAKGQVETILALVNEFGAIQQEPKPRPTSLPSDSPPLRGRAPTEYPNVSRMRHTMGAGDYQDSSDEEWHPPPI